MSSKSGISRVAEVLGLFGVIGSLIFVGIEVRQSAIATRAATDTAIADAFRDVNQVMATSPELARAMTAWPDSPDSLSAADQVQVLGLWRALFHTWSNAHRQDLNGTIDPAIFAAVSQEITTYAQAQRGTASPDLQRRGRFMRWAWTRERFLFNPDFQEFVDSIFLPTG